MVRRGVALVLVVALAGCNHSDRQKRYVQITRGQVVLYLYQPITPQRQRWVLQAAQAHALEADMLGARGPNTRWMGFLDPPGTRYHGPPRSGLSWMLDDVTGPIHISVGRDYTIPGLTRTLVLTSEVAWSLNISRTQSQAADDRAVFNALASR